MESDERLIVLDAGPLIHLDELDNLRLLAGFKSVYIPNSVWEEALIHRPALRLVKVPDAELLDPRNPPRDAVVNVFRQFELHAGEIAALTLLDEVGSGVFLSDDDAARQAGEILGFEVTGTLGILLRAVRRGWLDREHAVALFRDIRQRSTLHVSKHVLSRLIHLVSTAPKA
jgi:predicted nucleic acid-binding protein